MRQYYTVSVSCSKTRNINVPVISSKPTFEVFLELTLYRDVYAGTSGLYLGSRMLYAGLEPLYWITKGCRDCGTTGADWLTFVLWSCNASSRC